MLMNADSEKRIHLMAWVFVFCLAAAPLAFADSASDQVVAAVKAQSAQLERMSQRMDKIIQDQEKISTELEQIRYWVR